MSWWTGYRWTFVIGSGCYEGCSRSRSVWSTLDSWRTVGRDDSAGQRRRRLGHHHFQRRHSNQQPSSYSSSSSFFFFFFFFFSICWCRCCHWSSYSAGQGGCLGSGRRLLEHQLRACHAHRPAQRRRRRRCRLGGRPRRRRRPPAGAPSARPRPRRRLARARQGTGRLPAAAAEHDHPSPLPPSSSSSSISSSSSSSWCLVPQRSGASHGWKEIGPPPPPPPNPPLRPPPSVSAHVSVRLRPRPNRLLPSFFSGLYRVFTGFSVRPAWSSSSKSTSGSAWPSFAEIYAISATILWISTGWWFFFFCVSFFSLSVRLVLEVTGHTKIFVSTRRATPPFHSLDMLCLNSFSWSKFSCSTRFEFD